MHIHASDPARQEARDEKEPFKWEVCPFLIAQFGMLPKILIDQHSERKQQGTEPSERQSSRSPPTSGINFDFWFVLFTGPLIGVRAPDFSF